MSSNRRATVLVVLAASCGACLAPGGGGVPRMPGPIPSAPGPRPFARLLVATWDERGQRALESATNNGLVVFGSSQGRLVLLPDCRMGGQYQYVGVTPRAQHIALDDEAEVAMNVALDASTRPAAAPVAVDLLRVGRLATTRRTGQGAALLGSCEGATHFARTLSVGQIVSSPPDPEVRAACVAAAADDSRPPQGCRRYLRADLVALEGARFDAANPSTPFCPTRWAPADGICVEQGSGKAYECTDDDPRDCRAQCTRGNAGSCTRLGYMLAHGDRGFVQDQKQAAAFYQRACDLGHAGACFDIGVLHALGGQIPKDEKAATMFWERACQDGYPPACSSLGLLHARDATAPRARDRALALFRRACSGGDPAGCMNAVAVMRSMEPGEVDQEVGLLLDLACDGEVASGCLDLSDWLSRHGATPDVTRGPIDKACRLGSDDACRQHPGTQDL